MSPLLGLFESAGRSDSRRLFAFFDDRGRLVREASRDTFLARAQGIAASLLDQGVARGDRAVLVFPPSLDFAEAFVGCLLAGVVPVPVYPPDPMSPSKGIDTFRRVALDAEAAVALTTRSYWLASVVGSVRAAIGRQATWPAMRWIVTDTVRAAPGAFPTPKLDDLAFLQYTSGSTSAPKGVMISYGNLVHQLEFNRRALRMNADSRLVMWVPQYHDFGLISGILSVLAGNGQLLFVSPLSFVQRPAVWFELLHRERGTHTAAPTFGYELAVRKTTAAQRAGWDLSALDVAMCAAEPIHPDTARRFTEAFAVSRLRPEAFCPAYGLAEHTVGVTVGGRAAHVHEGTALVGCGGPEGDIDVRIVDAGTGMPVAAGQVGEIWVDSPSKALGYWNRPDETEATFRARLPGSGRAWLRTGDLGVVTGGELFVCGRLKDLIIVAGRNVHPQDIEHTVRDCHPLVRPGGIAAFALPSGETEGVGLFVELSDRSATDAQRTEVQRTIQAAVRTAHGLACEAIVLLPPGGVPKTTSGKVRRSECRASWSSGAVRGIALEIGTYEPIVQVPPPRTDTPADLRSIVRAEVAQVLGLARPEAVDADVPLMTQGLSSITAIDLADRLTARLGRDVPVTSLFACPTVTALVAALSRDISVQKAGLVLPAGAPVAVIGAGAAGLCAARALVRRGLDVTVIEASPTVGGKVSSVLVDGRPFELGQSIVLASYAEVLEIARELSIPLVPLTLQTKVVGDGSPETEPAMPWLERVLDAGRAASAADLERPMMPWLADRGLGRLPIELLEVWTAYGYGPLGADVAARDFVVYAKLLYDAALRGAVVLPHGNMAIWVALADALGATGRCRVELETPVSAIVPDASGVTVHAGTAARRFQAVVVATDPATAASLLPPEHAIVQDLRRFRTFEYNVTAADAELGPLPLHGLAAGNLTLDRTGHLVVYNMPWPDRGIGVFAQYGTSPERIPDETLRRHLADDLRALGATLGATRVLRRWRMFPHLPPGDGAALDRIEAAQGRDRLLFAGGYLHSETVEGAAISGRRAIDAHLTVTKPAGEPIAIVAASCRFGGGIASPEALWEALVEGRDVVTEVPPGRWDRHALFDADPDARGKTYARWGAFLDDVAAFDAPFFRMSPAEATTLDPKQRLLLECAWEAFERAGLRPEDVAGSRTGVYLGLTGEEYAGRVLGDLPRIDQHSLLGVMHNTAAGRLAHRFDLRGPALALDTACSSSLVAAHLAVVALQSGECDAALVGAANVMFSPAVTVALSRTHALSPTGRCRTFSDDADGYVRGEGAAVILLKRLSDARRDGDDVLATIRGSAVNQDGRSQALSAPNGAAQEAVIRDALRRAGVDAADVAYVECHGTGTKLGDPVEILALAAAYGAERSEPLRVGSVKTNLGHTEATAGLAGLLKAALSLSHGTIPPSLHFSAPNPHIPWDALDVEVVTGPRAWPDGPRLAGLSSFGMSGTNAHLVLEAPPPREPRPATTASGALPFLLSAASPAALSALAGRLRETDLPLPDLAAALARGRAPLAHRAAVVADTREALDEALTAVERGESHPSVLRGEARSAAGTVVVFSGQASQAAGMGRGLYEAFPAYRDAFDTICAAADPQLGRSLHDIVGSADLLADTRWAQPALFAVEVALYRLWASFGLEPAAVLGHSVGEVAAAHVAGVLDLPDAVRLVCARGRLMSERAISGGVMYAVAASEADVLGVLADGVSLAAINGPGQVVLSGDEDALRHAISHLGGRSSRLPVSHAFHSAHLDGMLEALDGVAATLAFHPARIPLISGVTGARADEELAGPGWWSRQARSPVRFADAVAAAGDACFLECGPGTVLSALVSEITASPAIPSLRPGMSEADSVARAVGQLHLAGIEVRRYFQGDATRARALPTYPFQRARYWIEEARPISRDEGLRRMTVAGVGDVFEQPLDAAWLADHRVGGRPIVPMAWTLEWLLAVARAWSGEPAMSVVDLRIDRPTPWSAGLVMQAIVDEAGKTTVHAKLDGAWTPVATATLAAAATTPAKPAFSAPPGDVVALYAGLAARGLAYGPEFQRLRAIGVGRTRATAEIDAPPAGDLRVHPAALDAAFHPIAAILGARGSYLPTGASRYTALRPAAGTLRATATISGPVEAGQAGFDVWLEDDHGLVAILEGGRATSAQRQGASLLAETWAPVTPEAGTSGSIAVFGAPDLADALQVAGLDARAAEPGDRLDVAQIVMFLPDFEATSLARRLARSVSELRKPPPVLVVTRRAQAVAGSPDPDAASIWGFVRSLRHELPGQSWRLRDVGRDPAAVIGALGPEPELVERDGAWYAPIRRPPAAIPSLDPTRALVARHAGTGLLDDVRFFEIEPPTPGPGEVRLAVRAVGLNFRDVLVGLALVPGAADGGMGGEAVGVVTATGPGATHAVGDRVAVMTAGCVATQLVVASDAAIRVPDGLTDVDAATLPLVFSTAHHALVACAKARPGERILVHAAAGGVGMAAIQLARSLGCEVLATAHPSKAELVRRLGVEHVAGSRDAGFADVLRRVAPDGVDVVIGAVTGDLVDAGLSLLRPGGRYVEIGKRELRDPAAVRARWGVEYQAFDLSLLPSAALRDLLALVLDGAAAGRITPLPSRTFPFHQLPAALRFMAEARHTGKIVLVPPASGGTALITGGLGALGQRMAAWLAVHRGVDRLVLMGRRADESAVRASIRSLPGVEVVLVAGDVTRAEDVARALEIAGPSLRWVVHAAGVIDDGLALRQPITQQRAVMAPKVLGTRHLDAQTRGRPLAGFLAFGSAASWHGSPGQSAYAAGNAAMQAIVERRRADGEPGTCIAWGPWEGGGMADGREVRKNLARLGVGLLDPEDALGRLDEILAFEGASVAVLASRAEATAAPAGRSDAPWDDQVRAIVGRVLGLPPDQVPVAVPLRELGLDSLSGIELRNHLIATAGRDVPRDLGPGLTVQTLADATR